MRKHRQPEPESHPVALPMDDKLKAVANCVQWLRGQGITDQHPTLQSVACERIPGIALCVTIRVGDRTATALLDPKHNYNAQGETWPWSWRSEGADPAFPPSPLAPPKRGKY